MFFLVQSYYKLRGSFVKQSGPKTEQRLVRHHTTAFFHDGVRGTSFSGDCVGGLSSCLGRQVADFCFWGGDSGQKMPLVTVISD